MHSHAAVHGASVTIVACSVVSYVSRIAEDVDGWRRSLVLTDVRVRPRFCFSASNGAVTRTVLRFDFGIDDALGYHIKFSDGDTADYGILEASRTVPSRHFKVLVCV